MSFHSSLSTIERMTFDLDMSHESGDSGLASDVSPGAPPPVCWDTHAASRDNNRYSPSETILNDNTDYECGSDEDTLTRGSQNGHRMELASEACWLARCNSGTTKISCQCAHENNGTICVENGSRENTEPDITSKLDKLIADLKSLQAQDIAILQRLMEVHFSMRMLRRNYFRRASSLMTRLPKKTSSPLLVSPATTQPIQRAGLDTSSSLIDNDMPIYFPGGSSKLKFFLDSQTQNQASTPASPNILSSQFTRTALADNVDKLSAPPRASPHPPLSRVQSEPGRYGVMISQGSLTSMEEEDEEDEDFLATSASSADLEPMSALGGGGLLKLSLDLNDGTCELLEDMPLALRRKYVTSLSSNVSTPERGGSPATLRGSDTPEPTESAENATMGFNTPTLRKECMLKSMYNGDTSPDFKEASSELYANNRGGKNNLWRLNTDENKTSKYNILNDKNYNNVRFQVGTGKDAKTSSLSGPGISYRSMNSSVTFDAKRRLSRQNALRLSCSSSVDSTDSAIDLIASL